MTTREPCQTTLKDVAGQAHGVLARPLCKPGMTVYMAPMRKTPSVMVARQLAPIERQEDNYQSKYRIIHQMHDRQPSAASASVTEGCRRPRARQSEKKIPRLWPSPSPRYREGGSLSHG